MGRGKSSVKKKAKKIREKNEANLIKMKEIGTQIKQEKEIKEWKTTLVTRAPRYIWGDGNERKKLTCVTIVIQKLL